MHKSGDAPPTLSHVRKGGVLSYLKDVMTWTNQVMLLCGLDLLESFVKPGVWRPGDVEHILLTHGVVCVLRRGCDPGALLEEEGAPLRRFRDHVILVKEPFDNSVSSSTVRQELRRGHCVKYIVSDAVIEYIKANRLYVEDEQETKVLG